MNAFHIELTALRERLAALNLEALAFELEALENHPDLLPLTMNCATIEAAQLRAHSITEHKLITARIRHQCACSESYPIINRIAEIERLLGAADRAAQLEGAISEFTERLHALQADGARIDAALSKLRDMQAETRAQVESITQASAAQLLAEAGIATADAGDAPKAAQIAQAHQALQSLGVAVDRAVTHQAAHAKELATARAELATAQRELLDAQCDVQALQHAQALGEYLPKLAALRRAELAARGRTGARVDVEALARAMLEAAQQ